MLGLMVWGGYFSCFIEWGSGDSLSCLSLLVGMAEFDQISMVLFLMNMWLQFSCCFMDFLRASLGW